MKIIKSIYNFLKEMGRIRARSYLARRGQYKVAEKLTADKLKGWI